MALRHRKETLKDESVSIPIPPAAKKPKKTCLYLGLGCTIFFVFVLLIFVIGQSIQSYLLGPWYLPGSIRDGTSGLLPNDLSPPLTAEGNPKFFLSPIISNGIIHWSWEVEEKVNLYCFRKNQIKIEENENKKVEAVEERKHVVLVVHGGPAIPPIEPWKALNQLEEEYPGKYLFIYYHQRGCGNSTRFVEAFANTEASSYFDNTREIISTMGLHQQVADIERLRKLIFFQLKKPAEPIIVIGHSFGAYIASLYAIEFPENVKGMISISPANMVVVPPPENMDIFLGIRKLLEKNKGENSEELKEFNKWLNSYFDFSPEIYKQTEETLIDRHFEFFKFWVEVNGKESSPDRIPKEYIGGWMYIAVYISMGAHHDFTSEFSSINIPILVIHGEQDILAKAGTESYSQLFAHSQYFVLPNTSHFSFNQNPDEVSGLVDKFISQF